MELSRSADGTHVPGSTSFGHGRLRHQGRLSAKEAHGVLAALAQEAYDISLLVAVTGSIVNSIVASRRPQLRTSMAAYLPTPPLLFPASVGNATVATAMAVTTIQSMISFYGLVAFARSATLAYTVKREPGGVAGPISMETLGEAWQAAATQSIGVLTVLGYLDKSSVVNDGKNNIPAARLIEMLWDVTLGRSPCVRVDGAVVIPGWIERRGHLRREVNAPATLSIGGQRQTVTVRDLSAGGLGLEGGDNVKPGDHVSISLGTGINLDGVAVWTRDGRVGVKLATQAQRTIDND